MKTVFQNELAPYNETDSACNGGFYKCPNCGTQLYVSEFEEEDIRECDDCGENHKIINN